MFFGDFLVEKSAVTKRQVLEALAYQVEQMPSLFRVAIEGQYISEDKLLKVGSAILNNKEFLDVVRRNGYLKEDEIKKMLEVQGKKRIPFGHILVKLGFLTFQQTQTLILEYLKVQADVALDSLKDVETNVLTNTEQPVSEMKKEDLLQKTAISFFDLEIEVPIFSFLELDDSLGDEFASLYDESKKVDLERSIISWQKGLAKDSLRDFYRELHTFKGTARFLKAFVTEFIIHNMENALSDIMRIADSINEADLDLVERQYLRGLDLLWELRMNIVNNQSEEVFWKAEGEGLVLSYLRDLKLLQKRCFEIESNSSISDFKDQF